MQLTSQFDGSQSPFEGDLTIMLRGIPARAKILSARVKITPANSAGPHAFEEIIDLTGAGSSWGAVTHSSVPFAEVDFLKRRTIVGIEGSQLSGASLQLDPGGAYLRIDQDGAIFGPGGPGELSLGSNNETTPSLTGVRFKLTGSGGSTPVINQVRVRSAPLNLSLSIGNGPTFWVQNGALAGLVESSDFAQMVQIYIDGVEAPEENIDIPLVVHSDSIARLLLDVEIEHLEVQSLVEDDLTEARVEFDFSGAPISGGKPLSVEVPQGMCVSAEGSSLRLRGAFADSRVVFAHQGDPVYSAALLPEEGLAQPLLLPQSSRVSAIDLLLAAETVAADLQVDIRNDADGKPGRDSLLPAPRQFDLHRRPDNAPQWLSVDLAEETELPGNTRIWVVVQSRQGKARWSAAATTASQEALQQSQAKGMAWRQARAASGASILPAGALRLRNKPAAFTMPLQLRVGEGEHAQTLSLDKYAATGRIDFNIDSRDLAATFNRYLEFAEQERCTDRELLVNRDFETWLQIGDQPGSARVLDSGIIGAIAFSPDGRTLYALMSEFDASGRLSQFSLQLWDPVCGRPILDPLPLGEMAPGLGRVSIGTVATPAASRLELGVSLDARHIWARTPDNRLTAIDSKRLAVLTGYFEPGSGPVVSDGQRVFYVAGQREVVEVPHSALLNALSASTSGETGKFERPSESRVLEIPPVPDNEALFGLALSPDAKQLYFGHVAPRDGPGGPAITIRRFDLERGREVGQGIAIAAGDGGTPPSALSFAVASDGTRMLVADGRSAEISVFNIASGLRDKSQSLSLGQPDNLVRVAAPALASHLVAAVSLGGTATARTFHLHSLAMGRRSPQGWVVLAGDVQPVCLEQPFRIAASIGTLQDIPGPLSAISQPAPVRGGCNYLLEFSAIASSDAARAELIWKGRDCSGNGKAEVPLKTVTPRRADRRGELQLHRAAFVAPVDATQAELRFVAPEGVRAVIGNISLRATAEALTNGDLGELSSDGLRGWDVESAMPSAVQRENGRTTITNVGEQEIVLTQSVPVQPGARMTLRWDGQVDGPSVSSQPALLKVHWENLDEPVTVQLSPLAAGPAITQLTAPEGVRQAEIQLLVPGGVSMSVNQVSFRALEVTEVPVTPVAETPGQLTLLYPKIALGRCKGPPKEPPAPPSCPPTPPDLEPGEMPEDCAFCSVCQKQVRLKPEQPTPRCPTCKSPVSGSNQGNMVRRLPLSRLDPIAIPRASNLRALSVIATASINQLIRVNGIAEARARKLYAAGIRDLSSLAAAAPERVLEVTRGVGVDLDAAKEWIDHARRLTDVTG